MKQSTANGVTSAKEAELANKLASDDPNERFECMKEIEQLLGESKIKENQYRKTWKALFYGLWVADKMKIQMDTAMKAAKMVHVLENAPSQTVMTWLKAGFEIFHREWDKLDYWRTSKFLSLARFCLNEAYVFLEGKKWNGTLVREWNQVLLSHVLGESLEVRSTGLTMHFLQVFVESLLELNDVPYKVLKALLEPFIELLSHNKDKTLHSKVIEYIFRVFVQNLMEGHFKGFNANKYAGYLLKKASSKDITEFNRKPLYTVQKEFLSFVAPENPHLAQIDMNDEEELGDEGIDVEIVKKGDTDKTNKKNKQQQQQQQEQQQEAGVEKKKSKKERKAERALQASLQAALQTENKQQGKAEKKAETKPEKKEEKGKLQAKLDKKQEEKDKKNKAKAQNNKNKAEEIDENDENEWAEVPEGEWEDIGDEDLVGDEDGDFEDFEEEVAGKKGKQAQNKKDAKNKAKNQVPEKKGKDSLKRGAKQLEEEDVEDDEDEDMDELPEDWEEELVDESLMDQLDNEEEEDETDMMTDNEYVQLLQQGLLGRLPPYLFQTPREQRAFFAKKNKEYFVNLEKAKKRPIPHARKVNFQPEKNTVKEFDKKYKLADKGDKEQAEIPGKGILKKSVFVSKSVVQTTNKNANNGNKANNKVNNKANKKNAKKKVKF